MASADRYIKTGDSWRPLIRVVVDDDGRAVDLSGALSVRFVARLGATKIDDAMTVSTVAAAVATGHLTLPPEFEPSDLTVAAAVTWDIEPEDTTVNPGEYPFEVEVTWDVGDIETFPTKRADNPILHIEADQDRAA